MSNNKYYTPTIDEFYVGFEYEFRHSDYKEDGWIKYNTPEFNYEREDSHVGRIDLSEFRVKYLDKEDIESLGWVDWRDMGMSCFRYNLKDPDNEFQLYYQFDNQYCIIYSWRSDIVFSGIIKNKSELKKLMKQLGINE